MTVAIFKDSEKPDQIYRCDYLQAAYHDVLWKKKDKITKSSFIQQAIGQRNRKT